MIRYVASLAAIITLAGTLGAESRALLVAVPRVTDIPEINSLEGPENDVAALRRTLIDHWGFRGDRIRTLGGPEATRGAILGALDRLADETIAGDHVLVYFSGHGVSAHDPATQGYGMRPDTGAIVPADLKRGSPAETFAGLIVGSRDLRPRFDRLDRTGAETLVLFDACYAGDSAKSPPRLVARSAELYSRGTEAERAFDEQFARTLDSAATATKWPYQRVVYISASARHELAWDIPARRARRERPTIDGLAHGAFTNGLLLGLRGEADLNRDGRIVYSELQEYLVGSVIRDGQTPQLRPGGTPVVERPVFGRSVAPERRGGSGEPQGLRVRLDPPDAELGALLESDEGIVVTAGEYDLEVRRQRRRFRMYLAAGTELGVRLEDRAAVARLLRRRARAQRIAHLAYPGQDMRLELRLEPEQGGIYYNGDELSIVIRPGEAAWLLLLAIDSAGGVISVYPFDRSQARRAGSGEAVRAVRLAAVPPFGTDLLEAFAFRDKPEGYDDWIGRVEPLNAAEAQRLYKMLRKQAGAPGRARASRIVYTVDR